MAIAVRLAVLLCVLLTQQPAIADNAAVDSLGRAVPAPNAAEAKDSPVILLHMHGNSVREGWTLVGAEQPEEGAGRGEGANTETPQADVIAPLDRLSSFADSSVTAIYAAHVLTRQPYGTMEFQGSGSGEPSYGGRKAQSRPLAASPLERTLREWHRVLKPGGALMLSVPDLHALAKLYLNDALTFAERFFVMRVIFGGQTTPHDFQRVGLDAETLGMYLNATGFCKVAPRTHGFGLFPGDASDMTFKGVQVSVNVAATACKPGDEGAIEVQIPDPANDAFDLAKLQLTTSGTHEQLMPPGVGATFRVHYEYPRGVQISPWHNIPLRASPVLATDVGTPLYHFICEIPKGTTAKMEVLKDEPNNPVGQDTKKGKLRFYKYQPEIGSLVNYGALPQTWEDPEDIHPDMGLGGDNDPIDVLQINARACSRGEVMPVRVLGTLALVDGGETDWKLIVVDARDPATEHMRDISDVAAEKVHSLREWFRMYKTAEGKGENKFGLGERAMDAKYAIDVIEHTHRQWKALRLEHTRTCVFNGKPCWM